ncbi:uncharacterized protein LOC143634479 [Bidens hawaiensis]|uniref:uncharacterized protein LOC143634479 n=1 Tax=Bidens hawaiensis TaxID=980011 RepID=UPI004048F2CC
MWVVQIKAVFRYHRIWDVIEPGSTYEKKNGAAVALFFQSIPEDQIMQVAQYETAKEIWNAIKVRYVGAERVVESTSTYPNNRIRRNEDERYRVYRRLFRETIQYSLKYEEAVGRLKAYEDRVQSVDDEPENNGKLLFNRAKTMKFKGKSKGEYEQSRDDSKGDRNKEGNSWKKRDYSGVQCFCCDEMGHFASVYPKRRGKRAEANLTEPDEPTTNKEVLMKISINEVFLKEENVHPKRYESESMEDGFWYLDNGVSNHMTSMKSYFSELDETFVGKVRFGDSSCVDIKGKGSITITCDDDVERIISNVYFILNLTVIL